MSNSQNINTVVNLFLWCFIVNIMFSAGPVLEFTFGSD